MKLLSFILLIACIGSGTIIKSQEFTPVQGREYEYSIETDEVGTGYKVVSYYLKNTCDKKLLFFNFNAKEEFNKDVALKALPEDIVILEPHRSRKICKLKITGDSPEVTWQAKILEPSVGFNKFPENGKNYMFFWKSSTAGNRITYSYLLKNTDDRRMKFYGFTLEPADGITISRNLPGSTVYLWPDSITKAVTFSLPSDKEAPLLNWTAEFTNFQPTGDEFCNQMIRILEAAGEGDFASVKGDIQGQGNYSCSINIPGINASGISEIAGKWQFSGLVEEKGTKKEINALLKVYTTRMDDCIPDIIALKIIKNKASKNKSSLFSGEVDGKTYSALLAVEGSEAQPNDYRLSLIIYTAE
jgi:hypothetical protein